MKILLRVDFNCAVVKGRIIPSRRMKLHAGTVKGLLAKGNSIVLLSHQGRKGDKDFLPLKQHAKTFSKMLGKSVKYIPSVYGKKALDAIDSLKSGEVLLLENVRTINEETKNPNAKYVKILSKHVDAFMNDAFSVSHRAHASVVGFKKYLPSYRGPLLERELSALKKFVDSPKKPVVYILGGMKVEENLEVAENILKKNKCDYILACGVFGELLLLATGIDLGAKTVWLKKNYSKLIERAIKLYRKFNEKIVMPIDLAFEARKKRREAIVEKLPGAFIVKDIGRKTLMLFGAYIDEAKTIIIKGPAGAFEEKNFSYGTKKLLELVVDSKANSLVGGGHIATAISALGFAEEDFTYLSTGGGSLIEYLSGKKLYLN